MKALSVRQPYADMIIAGSKDREYRSWKTNYRGRLVIVSSLRPAERYALDPNRLYGYALGTVELTEVVFNEKTGLYEWLLKEPRAFREPFRVKGRLSLFEVELPERIVYL